MDSEELYDMIYRNSIGVINELKNRISTIRSYKIKIGNIGGVWQNYDLSVENIDKCFVEAPSSAISVRIYVNSWNFLAFIFDYYRPINKFYITHGTNISEDNLKFLNDGTNFYTIEEVNKIDTLYNLIDKI